MIEKENNNKPGSALIKEPKEDSVRKDSQTDTHAKSTQESTTSSIVDLIKKEGLSVLFSGVLSAILISITQHGSYFSMRRFWKDFLSNFPKNKVVKSLLVNFLAAVVTAIITNPIYIVNTRMANNSGSDRKTNRQMFWDLIKNEGIKGLFKGLVPSLVLTINPMIQFTIYETLRRQYRNSLGELSNKNIILISFISKLVTTVITYPLITIKTLYMMKSEKEPDLMDIIRRQGLLAFYKGFVSKLIGSELNNIVLMLTYEKIQLVVKGFLVWWLFSRKIVR